MLTNPEVLTGYLDRPSYRPGEVLEAKTSSGSEGTIQLVRLLHGDTNPAGPGLQQVVVSQCAPATLPNLEQHLRPGSYGFIEITADAVRGFTISAWVWPTGDSGAIVSFSATAGRKVAVLLEHGRVTVEAESGDHPLRRVSTNLTLVPRVWQLVAVSFGSSARVHVWREGLSTQALDLAATASPTHFTALTIGARHEGEVAVAVDHYDGKIEDVVLWDGALDSEEIGLLANDYWDGKKLAAVTFAGDQSTFSFRDSVSGNVGTLFNAPTRAVTGRRWRGQVERWVNDPYLYGAVHFHSDDLEDADWQTTARVPLPTDLPPGVYALWLRTTQHQDWLPFIVTRTAPRSACRLVVLIPTLTYLAYANEAPFPPHSLQYSDARDEWVAARGLISQYNWHRDGSGVTIASWRRPLMNLRPDYRYWLTGHPHGLGADLYLLYWLETASIEYDIITDHDLHEYGAAILAGYQVLVTGSHPEYWTSGMLQTLKDFQARGTRVAYLGGNGLAALVAVHPERPWLSEMRRRGAGPGLWDSEPGEAYFAFTGDLGGFTRHHHLRARHLIGVDIAGMGFSDAQPYRKTPDAIDPRASFIFRGVNDDVFGDFGLHMGGAAGYEVDSVDHRTGTPAHALVVATCTEMPTDYEAADQWGVPRADMVFFETPSGGAVFSASSLTWTGSLSHANGENAVAQITANVLERFLDPTPFPFPITAPQ